jgi:ABC-type antimicrobial peptide transport system permease subunit
MKMKKMNVKLPSFLSKIVTSKIVLYLVALLSLISLIGYVMMGSVNSAILFVLLGYIMTFFSRNMVIVLIVPLVVVGLLNGGRAMKEGFDGTLGSAKDKKSKDEDHVLIGPDDHGDAISKIETSNPSDPEGAGQADSFEVGRKKSGQRIDYGSTIEHAYSELNDLLGSDGIKQLTDDSQKLMKQQMQLAEAMKSMTPMLETAKDMLKSLNINEIKDIASVAKNLSGGASQA